jgi:hypothetical protein
VQSTLQTAPLWTSLRRQRIVRQRAQTLKTSLQMLDLGLNRALSLIWSEVFSDLVH